MSHLTVRADEVQVGDGIDHSGYSGVVASVEPRIAGSGRKAVQINLDSFSLLLTADTPIDVVRWDR